jgi:hypothetical protein
MSPTSRCQYSLGSPAAVLAELRCMVKLIGGELLHCPVLQDEAGTYCGADSAELSQVRFALQLVLLSLGQPGAHCPCCLFRCFVCRMRPERTLVLKLC